MDREDRIRALKDILSRDPDSEDFFELAELLALQPEGRSEAREVCFRGLSKNPRHLQARLLLAKLFYEDDLGEFCVRELIELQKYSDAPAIAKLLDAFGAFAKPFLPGQSQAAGGAAKAEAASEEAESTVAEIDLDVEFDEAFEQIEES